MDWIIRQAAKVLKNVIIIFQGRQKNQAGGSWNCDKVGGDQNAGMQSCPSLTCMMTQHRGLGHKHQCQHTVSFRCKKFQIETKRKIELNFIRIIWVNVIILVEIHTWLTCEDWIELNMSNMDHIKIGKKPAVQKCNLKTRTAVSRAGLVKM